MSFSLDFGDFDFGDIAAKVALNIVAPGAGNSIVDAAKRVQREYEKKISDREKELGCDPQEIDDLVPSSSPSSNPNQNKAELCKKLRTSLPAQIAEGFKFIGGVAVGLAVVVGVALVSLVIGIGIALLPEKYRKYVVTAIKWLVVGIMYAVNFNWQMTDKQLTGRTAWVALAGQAGGLIGKSLGWLACGMTANAGIAVYNPLLAAKTLVGVQDEALEEITEEMVALLNLARREFLKWAFGLFFKGLRRFLKSGFNPFLPILNGLFGSKTIQNWGNAGNKPWSIATAVDNFAESFSNPIYEELIEELFDEFLDGCTESYIVLADSIAQETADSNQGKMQTVSILDKNV